VNDAQRLRHDPAMRWIVGGKAASDCAASASQMGRFETKWLAAEKNLSALADLSGQWIDRVHDRRPPRGILLDMDSSVSPTHGEQENSVWNGHYDCTCYHPLFVFNRFGDLERCALRPGNVHSADGWENVLKPVVARYRGKVSRIYFRADAGFANPDWYRRAADQGNVAAQALLGGMYLVGEGVPEDFVAAHMWYNLAAAHGDISAAEQRQRIATLMTPAQIAEAQKLAREWKPKPER